MKLLIDSDTIAFASAATAEDSEEWVAHARANEMVERIIADSGADTYELWLTGDDNFRYKVYPEYKAQRIGKSPPKWYSSTKQMLTKEWGANWSQGCEADDMVGVRQMEIEDDFIGKFDGRHDIHSMIAHIDKDINMIPGWHYNWELTRNGKVIRPAKQYFISDQEALKNFYYQLVVGDPTDGIKGVRGAGPKAAEKLLSAETEQDWFNSVREVYSCDEEMALNAQVLWIWRKMNDNVLDRFKELSDVPFG